MPKGLVRSSVYRVIIAVLILAGMPAARALDINGDGMDDLWQELYGIAPFDGRSDPDGDGLINLIESLSWSDPHNAASATSFIFFTDVDPADGLDDSWQAKYGI